MRAILYDKTCDCPSSELARGARRFLVKTGAGFVQRDAAREPVSEAQALEWLLHEDGLLRVPVLVWGGMLVRGYPDELYEQALSHRPAPGGNTAMILKETARSTYM